MEKRQENIDVQALSAGAVGGAISFTVSNGQFSPLNLMVSLTLAGVLVAYLWVNRRSTGQSFAVAMVLGLVLAPLFGMLDEMRLAGNFPRHFLADNHTDPSMVPSWHVTAAWAALSSAIFLIDIARQRTFRRADAAKEAEAARVKQLADGQKMPAPPFPDTPVPATVQSAGAAPTPASAPTVP